MLNTLMIFDFGASEEAAQDARHKLDVWKQAYRLDKKLLFKFDRAEGVAKPEPPAKAEKGKSAAKDKARSGETAPNGNVKLLVRLYFSGHEKLSFQRWIDRIPADEHFKSAKQEVFRSGEAGFDEAIAKFDALD